MHRTRQTIIAGLCVVSLHACAAFGGAEPVPSWVQGVRTDTLNSSGVLPPDANPAKLGGTVTLESRLAITPYRRLLAVVTPWSSADIDHVSLTLYEGATSKGVLSVPQSQLATVVRINNLLPNTAYTIRARAWQDAGETTAIDNYDVDPATCTTAFTTTTESVLSLGNGIALKLRDKAFSGLGAGALTVNAGGYFTGSPEAIAVRTLAGTVTTLAGSTQGYADGTGAAAQFSGPEGVDVDSAGNVYVADYDNHRIRKISPSGVVTTLAGSTNGFADGTGAAAQFYWPVDVAVDGAGNVYVADSGNHRVRKISPTGVVTTVAGSTQGDADGTGTAAQFDNPTSVALDASGNLYVLSNQRVRKIDGAGVVTTLAGSTQGYADGTGTAAQFGNPYGLAVDLSGNVYIADWLNHRIRKMSPAGVVTTLAGSSVGYADGTGTAAQFYYPAHLAVDPAGNIYVTDYYNNRIRKVSPTGVVTTVTGATQGYADGTGTGASFSNPSGMALDASGNLYVGDAGNQRIRKIQ